MKSLRIFFLVIICIGFYTLNLKAQIEVSELTEGITDFLEASDFTSIQSAESKINEANQMIEDLAEEDERLEKYFKKSEKKGEKKSVDAKWYRIDAARIYLEGLKTIYRTLDDRLKEAEFEFSEDQARVESLRRQADENFTKANTDLTPYLGLDKKGDLKKIQYYFLIDELKSITQIQIDGIERIKEGFFIVGQQAEKKERLIADNNAWETALNENTIEAFQGYVDNFPTGRHTDEALSKIADIEAQDSLFSAQEKQAALDEQMDEQAWDSAKTVNTVASYETYIMKFPQGMHVIEANERIKRLQDLASQKEVFYTVQIFASRNKLSEEKLKKLYSGEYEIRERQEDGWFKYTIGEFDDLKDATELWKSLKIQSFLVGYYQGERVMPWKARKIQKKLGKR
ncbi:SPOR domain-containing protein [Bacteroidota bacterium]